MCITEWQCLQKQNTVISDIRITSLDAIIFFFWSATNNYTRSRKRENRIMKTIYILCFSVLCIIQFLLVKYFLNLFSVLCYRIRIPSSRIKVLRNAVYSLFNTLEPSEAVYINKHECRQHRQYDGYHQKHDFLFNQYVKNKNDTDKHQQRCNKMRQTENNQQNTRKKGDTPKNQFKPPVHNLDFQKLF